MHTMSKRPSSGKDTGVETIKEELVRFDNVKSSYFTEVPRVTLTYTLSPNTPFSPHDWIGLFPLDYPDTSDPLAFTSAALKVKPKKKKKRGSNEDKRQVEFPIKDASINIVTDSKTRRYQFVYVSKSGQVYGESRTFSIQGEELWSLADDDEEYSRLSTRHSSATTLLYDSEISILSRSPATSTACPSESPVLLSYPSSDMESDAGDVITHQDDWDMTNLGSGSDDDNNSPQHQQKGARGAAKNGGGGGKNVSETALSEEEFSDIEVLSTSPSKDDNCGGLLTKGSRQCNSSSLRRSSNDGMIGPDKAYPEDDFTLCDIKTQSNQFCVLGDNTGENDGLMDDNNEEEKRKGDDRAATKKSKRRKREKRKAESMDEMSMADDVNDTLEDKSLKSEPALSSFKKSKREKKGMELEKSRTEENIDVHSGTFSEKLPKELLDKSKRKLSKCEPNEEKVRCINVEDSSDCSSVKKSKSKKSRKEKKEKELAEAVVVNVERMFSPPLSQHLQQTFLKTVTDPFRFLEVEDDVLSIRLSDVEGDEKDEDNDDDNDDEDDDGEEEKNRVSSSVMSKKEKRKMRKMKERMGDEKSSSNKKPMIVELSTVVEKEEEKKKTKKKKKTKNDDTVVNNGEAQMEDRVTGCTQKPIEVNTDEETARVKRRKKKTSERGEPDPETTTPTHTSRGKDASSEAAVATTIDNLDKSTLPVTSSVSDKKITARRSNDKSMTESKINATSPPLLKGKHGGKKVPKDNNKGMMSVYFETVAAVAAAPASTTIITEQETTTPTSINNIESQKCVKNDRRPKKDASGEKSEHSKVTKKCKRQCKDEKVESADEELCTKHNDDTETIVMNTVTIELRGDRSGETKNHDALSGQSGKRCKKSRRSLSDNQEGEGIAATVTNTPTASDALSDKREHSNEDDSTKILKSIKKSNSLDNDEKQQRIVKKSRKTSESEDSTIKSKEKTRKIPKTIPAEDHVSANDTNTPDAGGDVDCVDASSKKKPKIKNRVQDSVVEKHEIVTDADILNNNIGEVSVCTKSEDKKQDNESKKKRRKSEVESPQKTLSETNDSGNIQEEKKSGKGESNVKKEEKTSKSKRPPQSSTPEMNDKQQTVNSLKECSSSAKPDERKDISQANDVIENEAPEGTKKEKKNKKLKTTQAEIENKDENICSEISLEKYSSFNSNSEKPNTESRSADKKILKKLKQARSEECWEERGEGGSEKENSRTSIRNKMYLTKKEKMKAALKARIGKKERRGKSKSDKVIRLKELFDESFASCSDWEDDTATTTTTTNVIKPTTSIPARGTTSKQPRRMIPAYLLDVMDDLPQNPDTPNFHQWRKSMAHGCAGKNNGKVMTCAPKDEETDTETLESKNLKKASLELDASVDVAAAKERKTQENLAKTGSLPPSPSVAKIEKLVDNSSDDNDDDKKVDDRRTGEKSLKGTTPIDVSLMSYADVLKGISTCMRMALCTNNLIPSKSLIQIAKRRMHGNAKNLHPPFDRKALIRNRRDIFSWGLENLTTASLETQCYLLDKVEDRLMGRHPQFSRRTKIRAARKIRTEKQRHKKLMQKRGQNRTQKQALNEEMISTNSIPMCTSLAWEPASKKTKKRSVNLISNKNDSDDDDDDDNVDDDDSISSVTWPLPRDLTAVVVPSSFQKNVRSDEEATVSAIIEIGDSWPPSSWIDLDKVNDNDDDDGNNIVIIEDLMSSAHASSAETWAEEKTTPNGDDECLGVVEELNVPTFNFASRIDDDQEEEDDEYDFVRKIERCSQASSKRDARSKLEDVTACLRKGGKSSTPPKRESVRFPGLPKSLGLAHAMLEKLKTEGKVKDREIATLEGEVHCLKEVIKAHTKQEFKTRIKLFAVKRKYNSLKAARIGQRVTVLNPEMPRSKDDVSQGNESDNEESLSADQPLSKKRKLEESPHWGQQTPISFEATAKPEKEIFPLNLKKARTTNKSLAESANIYPDIQQELKELQREVDKYSYGPNLQDQHTSSQKQEKQQLEFSRQQTSFTIPSSPSLEPASIAGGWERESPLRYPEDAFNFHPKHSSMEHQSLPGPYFRHSELSQQHKQRHQQQQQHSITNCLFTTESPHDQQTPNSVIFSSMTPHPTSSSSKNLPGPVQNQHSPPKPALLPTPTKAPQTSILSDKTTPPPTAANPNMIPPTNNQPPSPNTLRTNRGYSCPPYQRSRSSTVDYHQTSPTWKRHPSQSSAQRPNNAFGNTRYSPMTRPPPHPATVVVAPRPRYFNRPFLCNNCSSQVPYAGNGCHARPPSVATGAPYGRYLIEPYSDYRPGLFPISDGYKPPALENFPAWNQPVYLGHEQHFNARLPPPPPPPPSPPCCYFTLPEDHPSVTGSTSSYFSNYPHLDSSCSLPRQDCNCCPNNFNLPYTP